MGQADGRLTAQPTPRPRITPLAEPSPEVLEILVRGGVRITDGRPLNIFATLARHPDLLEAWLPFGNHVLAKSTLSRRDRELLILRVAYRCRSHYEFSQHVLIARRAEISATEIESVRAGPDDPSWSPHDRALLRAVDELHDDSAVSDNTWSKLAAVYTTEQMLDLVFTVGHYKAVAMALNSFGVELDDGVPDVL
jgi:4-carboxymuconolactone decarboxylase